MMPEWFNNWVGPIMLTVLLSSGAVMAIMLCLLTWREFKPNKGNYNNTLKKIVPGYGGSEK